MFLKLFILKFFRSLKLLMKPFQMYLIRRLNSLNDFNENIYCLERNKNTKFKTSKGLCFATNLIIKINNESKFSFLKIGSTGVWLRSEI